MNPQEKPLLNAARGEVPVQIGAVHLGIAVGYAGLARLSRAAGTETMQSLYARLLGFEPWTVSAAIKVFSVDGDGPDAARERADAAVAALTSADEAAWRMAIEAALAAHLAEGEKRRAESYDLVAEVEEALDAVTPGKPLGAAGKPGR
ncbi:hypothetical protein [Hoeflea sp.]|uniref:hypothetical protein n=1 Tax=Hoeflea sp. TaxID=1940281 RepID=UPI0019A15429|nr:hypothetical protein [Hoeflea sp.]MBC7280037.1 hypothetical protein [Hoeflea sp.]